VFSPDRAKSTQICRGKFQENWENARKKLAIVFCLLQKRDW